MFKLGARQVVPFRVILSFKYWGWVWLVDFFSDTRSFQQFQYIIFQ